MKEELKEEFKFAVGEIVAGMREACQLFVAIIAAPFLVCKEFATSTGRWAPKRDRASEDAVGERTGA